jgi:hypothetical protein
MRTTTKTVFVVLAVLIMFPLIGAGLLLWGFLWNGFPMISTKWLPIIIGGAFAAIFIYAADLMLSDYITHREPRKRRTQHAPLWPKYMMATIAKHKVGDLSRREPSLCCIHGEEGENFIGQWVEGFGFFNVQFPKATTRELTGEEKIRFRDAVVIVGDHVARKVNVS